MVHCGLAQQAAAIAGGIADVQDDVADRLVVELARIAPAGIGRQLQLPFAEHTGVLEWQVTLVAQVGLEQAERGRSRKGDLGDFTRGKVALE